MNWYLGWGQCPRPAPHLCFIVHMSSCGKLTDKFTLCTAQTGGTGRAPAGSKARKLTVGAEQGAGPCFRYISSLQVGHSSLMGSGKIIHWDLWLYGGCRVTRGRRINETQAGQLNQSSIHWKGCSLSQIILEAAYLSYFWPSLPSSLWYHLLASDQYHLLKSL